MRHRVKKVSFRGGRDATRMMVRKLLTNFIRDGRLTTTQKRIKVLRSQIEVLVHKAKRANESDKNVILSKLSSPKLVDIVIKQIAPVFKDVTGGYVRIVKLNQRVTDGAQVARLEWVKPVVIEKVETKKEIKKKNVKKEVSSKEQSIKEKPKRKISVKKSNK